MPNTRRLRPVLRVGQRTSQTHEFRLVDTDGDPIDVSDADVTFTMEHDRYAYTAVEGGAATVVDGAAGLVEHEFSAAETSLHGRYKVQFEVDYGSSTELVPPEDDTWVLDVGRRIPQKQPLSVPSIDAEEGTFGNLQATTVDIEQATISQVVGDPDISDLSIDSLDVTELAGGIVGTRGPLTRLDGPDLQVNANGELEWVDPSTGGFTDGSDHDHSATGSGGDVLRPSTVDAGSVSAERAGIDLLTEPRAERQTQYNNAAARRYRGYQVDNFEDLTDWSAVNGSVSADSSDPYIGTQSAHLDPGSAGETTIDYDFASAQDLTGVVPTLAMKTSGYPTSGSGSAVRVEFLDSSGNRYIYGLKVANTDIGWRRYDFSPGRSVNDPVDFTSISTVRIWPMGDGDVWVDDLRFVETTVDTKTVIFQFDDGYEADYSNARPILNEYGMPSCHAVPIDYVGDSGRLSLSQMREMQAEGCEFNSHGTSHTAASLLSDSELRDDLRDAKDWLVENGFQRGADHHVWVGAELSSNAIEIASDYFQTGAIAHNGGAIYSDVSAPLTIHRQNGETLSDAQTVVDEFLDNDQNDVLMFMIHEVGSGGAISTSDFRSLVEYVADADLNVETVSDVF